MRQNKPILSQLFPPYHFSLAEFARIEVIWLSIVYKYPNKVLKQGQLESDRKNTLDNRLSKVNLFTIIESSDLPKVQFNKYRYSSRLYW